MVDPDCLPRITTLFDSPLGNPSATLYKEAVRNTLIQVIPQGIFFSTEVFVESIEDQRDQFHALLPIFSHSPLGNVPYNQSFFLLSKYRANAFKFFFDMISRWLVPGKRLNVVVLYAADFQMPDLSDETYTVCEVVIRVEHEEDLLEIQRNLPIIESEVCLGVESSHYARRILEIKGLSSHEKTAMIQEYIAYLVGRLPKYFDYDVFTEMQHVLVMAREEFKAIRECQHLSRIISIHYLIRKAIRDHVKNTPEKRHLSLKLFRTRLNFPEGVKSVLAVLVGVNFLKEKEIFEEIHLLKAIQNYVPEARAVPGSFFANRRGSEHICTLYLEIEKADGHDFSGEDVRILRKELPSDLKDRIEHLMHPVFMPRNEEEIMRNILSLSNQIKFIRDIPQVFISFDEQTHANIFFTVILARVLVPGSASILEMFKNSDTFLEYVHDRCKMVGFLRKRYAKEATVFRVKFRKDPFLRRDHSIDLYKARQTVVDELSRIVGEVRDFNGGMISKQNELFCAVRDTLGEAAKYNELLLENFFYSLAPVIMRTLIEPHALKTLFLMLLETIEQGFFKDERYTLKIQTEPGFVYAIIASMDRSIKGEIIRALNKIQFQSSELANSYVKIYDIPYIGYIYRCHDVQKQTLFSYTLQSTVENWAQKKKAPALIP
jgi:hypothetical protein